MLSERITRLFQLLQCSNTEIARYAGCSPSNISRLKSGTREPGSGSRTVLRLVEGVVRYADYENMLSMLCELCGAEDTRAEVMIPALLAWLYEDSDFTPPHPVVPKSKRTQEMTMAAFGERLDQAMTLLELSNGQLAAQMNVDDSLVSRYRSGIYYPHRNGDTRERLSELLFACAEKKGRLPALAELCQSAGESFDAEVLRDWLFASSEEDPSALAESLFRSIDAFTPGQGVPAPPPELPPIREAERYWGTEGLRIAVVRFLDDAAREGGELLLYSDEPMTWMSGDAAYFSLWAALMAACIREGVHIRIIHNIDRVGSEMISAINGWFPLYISGQIEPYIFRRTRSARFHHTVFLRPGGAGILGFFPADAEENRWYDYITDKARLDALESGYGAMLACASPFLKTYPASSADEFWRFYRAQPEKNTAILDGLSVASMPEALLDRILTRAAILPAQRGRLMAFHRDSRQQLFEILAQGALHELVCLPDREAVEQGRVSINFGTEPTGLPLAYTPEEYAEHAAAVRELVSREKNYHLTLLPSAHFRDLQILTMKDAVAVLRCREPYTAFVFMNAALTRSVSDYCHSLIGQYAADRFTTMQALDKLYR